MDETADLKARLKRIDRLIDELRRRIRESSREARRMAEEARRRGLQWPRPLARRAS